MSDTAAERRDELVALYREARACTLCPLHQSRTQVVFGNGHADADLMFVGEAPGANEDAEGLPFVGRAGQLLDEMLRENEMTRADVFVTNVLKSRPPGNRDPEPGEIEACRPYLQRQVELIAPRVICTLGNFATKLLSGSSQGITRVHGVPQRRELGGREVTLYPLFHPAAALRTPRVKEQLSEDFARLPALLAAGAGVAAGPPAAETDASQEVPQPAAEQMGLFGG